MKTKYTNPNCYFLKSLHIISPTFLVFKVYLQLHELQKKKNLFNNLQKIFSRCTNSIYHYEPITVPVLPLTCH